MRAIIIDDFRLARLDLLEHLQQFEDIKILCDLGDSIKSVPIINREQPDIIFVDINMPGLNGFELSAQLTHCPFIVYTTAYSQYALKAFNHNAFDYLLKPVSADRLSKTIEKARSQLFPSSVKLSQPFFSIRRNNTKSLYRLKDIDAFESYQEGTRAYLKDGEGLCSCSLTQLEERVEAHDFFRLSRQSIVNLNSIYEVASNDNEEPRAILHSGQQLKISRRQYLKLKHLLLG